ncbi:hypothetical protein [Actinokineospora sp. UTMC 2448]|uniref:hypothetical protein n=1 Tax=Actinokineospora sp. UTMC 2448 TaxID=2268449 RepID=UPI00216445F1|nr:hypothetical protein [Actinokineospora sp. UTMC 2448]UVS81918.1 hypothetical protein Actkin_05682 [Actinokineospora sp. UTMC 2448]
MTAIAWETDTDLGLAAHRLGEKIMEMYDKAGIPTSTGFDFGPNSDSPFITSIIIDAQDFATLDPQKIIDESERLRAVWNALSGDDHAVADLEQAAANLAVHWHGEAADRFHDQMIFIREYLVDHARVTERAVLALGMMLAVAARVRRNFRLLADGVVVACEQEMAAQEVRTAEAATKRSATVINGVVDLFSTNPAELLKNGIKTVTNIAAAELEIDLKKTGAPEVVASYIRGRDALRVDFEDAMTQIEQWVDRETAALGEESVALLRPLPASYSPSSPDFRYELFASGYRPSEHFGPKVERQRTESQTPDPNSAVTRRLEAQ